MPYQSPLRTIVGWFRRLGAADPSACNDARVAEAELDVDAAAGGVGSGTAQRAAGRLALERLAGCGPFRDEAGYARFAVLAARALSLAGLLAEVPAFLEEAGARLPAGGSARAGVEAVRAQVRTVAEAVRSGLLAGPEFRGREEAEARALLQRVRAVGWAGRGP